MKNTKSYLSQNLVYLRQYHKYSQERVAEKIGVSRQAVAKWESGETVPDILNCSALAELYQVSLDDLFYFNREEKKMEIPPKGKHLFGTVIVGERGQIVLPKKAREIFHINPGDLLVVLGDEAPERAGIALIRGDAFLQAAEFLKKALHSAEESPEKGGGR